MNVTIQKGRACGTVSAPPSKSMAHRLLICAGLSPSVSHINNVDFNEDILATIDCLRAFGAECTIQGDVVTVKGIDPRKSVPSEVLNCRESGSTLRFFIPLSLLSGKKVTLIGTEKLLSRPLNVYEKLCAEYGFSFVQDSRTVEVSGCLSGGCFSVPGDISSQFITGLLFALPLAGKDSVIKIAPPLESRGYIDLTLQSLHTFGIRADWLDAFTLEIPGNQTYAAVDATVEGDYSGAAFFAALRALGNDVTVAGLRENSLQGDKVYEDYFEKLCNGTPTLHIADCPDLGPILFAVAAAKNGAVFTGTRRLKIKESDRAAAMAEELAAFGTEVIVEDDTVKVIAKDFHAPTAALKGHNDHRIVMSISVLLTRTGGTIKGAQAVRKSFPDFFDRLASLGIEVLFDETNE
ncbi:MAG: 3-phosphoshikimate 1-carboxyvinyltransferase [Oscillospiraceae bacterium]|nr:3-phosphoshikimate 1-carboxyvinyltransferase [Oscillospiraceae bacterium]